MPHQEVYINDVKYPSVTEIAKLADDPRQLIDWAKKNTVEHCDRVFLEAQELGLEFHDHVAAYLKDGVIDEASRVRDYIRAIAEWKSLAGFSPTYTEQYVESKQHLYGGTLDTAGTFTDIPLASQLQQGVVDFKLTTAVRKSHIIQPVGYMQGLLETFNWSSDHWRIVRPYRLTYPAKATEIVRLKRGYKYCFKDMNVFIEERRYNGFDRYFEIFLGLRKLYDFVHGEGEWKELGK